MLRLIILILFLPAFASSQDLNRKHVDRFWAYVQENEKQLSESDDIVLLFGELNERLNKVQSELAFEFGPKTMQPRQLVISADGYRPNFAAVEALVATAPKFRNLEIVAFRQPIADFSEFSIIRNGVEMKASDLTFAHFTDRGEFVLLLVHDAFGSPEREEFIAASFIILDAAVGEYRVTTEIGAIDFVPKAAITEGYPLIPIAKLPEELDRFISAR